MPSAPCALMSCGARNLAAHNRIVAIVMLNGSVRSAWLVDFKAKIFPITLNKRSPRGGWRLHHHHSSLIPASGTAQARLAFGNFAQSRRTNGSLTIALYFKFDWDWPKMSARTVSRHHFNRSSVVSNKSPAGLLCGHILDSKRWFHKMFHGCYICVDYWFSDKVEGTWTHTK